MKVLAISNKIKVVNTDYGDTKIISFGDDSMVFGIDYPSNPSFNQQLRLDMKLWKQRQQESGSTYRNNAGVMVNNNLVIDRILDVETGYFDAGTHLAMSIATKHKYFYIDGKRYFRNSDYEINWDDSPGDILMLAPAKATFTEQGKGFTNQAC
jgi:hypothetical protein